jgi:hypothetical protein
MKSLADVAARLGIVLARVTIRANPDPEIKGFRVTARLGPYNIQVKPGSYAKNELEFDLPRETSLEDRARDWQFPARVFASSNRPLQLLNRLELEARVRSWLKRGGLTEALCGRWVFTWTGFKIECDPNSVLEMLETYNLRLSDLRDGAL